jgi:hypothetical protein
LFVETGRQGLIVELKTKHYQLQDKDAEVCPTMKPAMSVVHPQILVPQSGSALLELPPPVQDSIYEYPCTVGDHLHQVFEVPSMLEGWHISQPDRSGGTAF